jgi:hypothetical protein
VSYKGIANASEDYRDEREGRKKGHVNRFLNTLE